MDDIEAPDAILTRSNGGMIQHIVEELEKGRTVGVPKNTKKDLESLSKPRQRLAEGVEGQQSTRRLRAKFKSWDEFEKEAKKVMMLS